MLSSTPVECPAGLLETAVRLGSSRAAVVNATSAAALESARQGFDAGIVEPVLVGDCVKIEALCDEIGWDISGIEVVHAASEAEAAATAVAMARNGSVDVLSKGDIHTDTLLRAVLHRENGLTVGKYLSHVFCMTVQGSDRLLAITDAVINVLPTLEQKVDIAVNAIELLHALGNRNPNIALLSATEVETSAMPSSVEAARLRDLLRQQDGLCATVDGPMAFDLAVSVEAAAVKNFTSDVAGNADILLVPNIETGNALFKMMVYFMSAAAAGIVLGAKVPITLTSRADPAAARLASTAVAAIYARASRA